ncbi:MAG: sulfurtransferase [Chloroflexi bacterium]|nr:sulfurtransferase [Chloroflexota bacterium]
MFQGRWCISLHMRPIMVYGVARILRYSYGGDGKIVSQRNPITKLQLPGVIVTPEWLGNALSHPDLRLVDLRSRESYDDAHIPGAVWLDLKDLAGTIDGVPGMLLPPDAYAKQIGRLGIDQDSVVVLYDENWGMPAARVLWSLARYGLSQAAVLTGGWDRWQEEGRSQTAEVPEMRSAHFVPQADDSQVAERSWLLRRLEQGDLILIDTRAPAEYNQGHIPGSLCWDWVNGIPAHGWDTLGPEAELRTRLAELGVTPDREVVTYCRSGARAAHTYLLLRHLGFPKVRLYDGSWLEWSRYQNGGAV